MDEKLGSWNDRMLGDPDSRYVPLVPNKYLQDKVACSCGGRLHYGGRADLGGTGLFHCDDCAKTWTVDQTKSSSANEVPPSAMEKFYHVAPTAVRNLIEQNGLQPWQEGNDTNHPQFTPKPVVHLFRDPQKADEFASQYADIYPQVNPGDPSYNEDELRNFDEHSRADIWEVSTDQPTEMDNRLDGAVTVPAGIPPENLNMVGSLYLTDMPRYQEEPSCPTCGTSWDEGLGYCPECDPPESRQASSWNDRMHHGRSRNCPPAEYRQWNCPLCGGDSSSHVENEEGRFNQRTFEPDEASPVEKQSAETTKQLAERLRPNTNKIIAQHPNGWTVQQPTTFADLDAIGDNMGTCWEHTLDNENIDMHYSEHPDWPDDLDWSEDRVSDEHINQVENLDLNIPLWEEGSRYKALYDPHGVPRLGYDGGTDDPLLGRHNSEPKPEYQQIWDELEPQIWPDDHTADAEFPSDAELASIEDKWPNLESNYGYYIRDDGSPANHFWSRDPNGTIVDVNSQQFGSEDHVIDPSHPFYDRYVSYQHEPEQAEAQAHRAGESPV